MFTCYVHVHVHIHFSLSPCAIVMFVHIFVGIITHTCTCMAFSQIHVFCISINSNYYIPVHTEFISVQRSHPVCVCCVHVFPWCRGWMKCVHVRICRLCLLLWDWYFTLYGIFLLFFTPFLVYWCTQIENACKHWSMLCSCYYGDVCHAVCVWTAVTVYMYCINSISMYM